MEIQLELPMAQSQGPMAEMQVQIDAMAESMGKVRRKLFAKMSELERAYLSIEAENHDLKCAIRDIRGDKMEWLYCQNGSLFEEPQKSISMRSA
jgi:hypothetical protein